MHKSWLPLTTSCSTFFLLSYFLFYFNNKELMMFLLSLAILMIGLIIWFKELNAESFMKGFKTKFMEMSFKFGMVLFIFSEVMFFTSFFWSYLHFMLNVNGEIGLNWPPININKVNYKTLPLLNSIFLLSSGYFLTISHSYIIVLDKDKAKNFLLITMKLGVLFLFIQNIEYFMLEVLWSESTFGSVFYMTTGFHGIHVLIGTMFLLTTFMTMKKINYLVFEMSAWYWHFVDVVWLMLFLLYYWLPCL